MVDDDEEFPLQDDGPWGSQFEKEVRRILPRLLGPGSVSRRFIVPEQPIRPDLVYEHADGRVSIVEIKSVLPGTRPRLESIVAQLNAYSHALEASYRHLISAPGIVLVVAGVLSVENLEFLRQVDGLRVIDEEELRGVEAPARRARSRAEELSRALRRIPPGRENAVFVAYQKMVRDVLEYLLCPPLGKSIYESADYYGFNRRDMIFPNYVESGFWHYMRQTYEAHYVVVDAKNYSTKVKKKDVLQLANYLSRHGAGLFGIIVTRHTDDPGSEFTRREQWLVHGKLMIVLNDADILQMLTMKESGDDPALLIRQKVEDFRISF